MAHHPKTEQFIRAGLFSNLESFVDLEKRISLIDDEKTKGDAFEVFASVSYTHLTLPTIYSV